MSHPFQIARLPKADVLRRLEATSLRGEAVELVQMPGGRSNSVWKVETRSGAYVFKLFGANNDNPLFPNDAVSEQVALRHYHRLGFSPRLVEAGTDWVIYDYVEASPWQNTPEIAGRGLAHLHSAPALSGLRVLVSGTRNLIKATERILSACPEDALGRIPPLARFDEVPEQTALCGLHGDPVPSNILCAGPQTLFIDWQCPAIGDPCEDIAVFLSPAMQVTYRGAALSETEEGAFWQGYQNPVVEERYQRLKPHFHRRMMAYCLWRNAHRGDQSEAALHAESAALRACA